MPYRITRWLEQFSGLINVTTIAALGSRKAQDQLESVFPSVTAAGWFVADPIRRMWAGERDERSLTAHIDQNSAFVVREILRRL